MTIKKKKCKSCPSVTYIFSKGECKRCAQVRYAKASQKKERTRVLSKSENTKRGLSKIPTERHKEAKDRELKAMQSFWREHEDFDNRCNCFECNKSLEFDRTHCAHILGKGAYPQLRDNQENFIILCFEHHQQFDFGERSKMKVSAYCEEIEVQLKQAA